MSKMVNTIDDIAEFEEFRREILPAIRQDMSNGMTAEELRTKYEAVVTARFITIAATSENESAAVAAGKDIQDRSSGRPKERKEIEHRLGKLPDQELEAILLSEMDDISGQDSDK